MKGICVKFYTYELQKHHGILLHEWLLELAKKNGIQGGSAFRAIAGFGRHGVMHEEHFFELASNVPIQIEFFMSAEEVEVFLETLRKEKIDLFYTKFPMEYGSLSNGDHHT